MISIFRLVSVGVFIVIAATIAAFVYLVWYQACLVSAFALFTVCYVFYLLVRRALGRLEKWAFKLFEIKSQVLRNAAADIHAVRPIPSPSATVLRFASETGEPEDETEPPDLDWYELEFTIFPDARLAGSMKHWDLDDLRLVPFTAKVPTKPGEDEPEDEVSPLSTQLIEEGEAFEPEGSKLQGPQRLRIVAGFPPGIAEWKLRYYFESFGHIRLPGSFA